MNYEKIYRDLYRKAKNRDKNFDGENHHFIPKSVFNTKLKYEISNILGIEAPNNVNDKIHFIRLTLREHYIAHIILFKIFNENSLIIFAANIMMNRFDNSHNYNELREKFKEHSSMVSKGFGVYIDEQGKNVRLRVEDAKNRNLKGVNTNMVAVNENGVNKQVTKEEYYNSPNLVSVSVNKLTFKNKSNEHFYLDKISVADFIKEHELVAESSGRVLSKDHKESLVNSRRGKTNTKDHNKKISGAQKGKTMSEESKIKLSKAAKGMYTCYDKKLNKRVKITVDVLNKDKSRYLNLRSNEYSNNFKHKDIGDDKKLSCITCKKTFIDYLYPHNFDKCFSDYDNKTRFKCKYCEKEFDKVVSRRSHERNCNPKCKEKKELQKTCCLKCKKVFDKGNLAKHLRDSICYK